VAVVAACDESFDPIAPSELAFSVFGYLDASAETQWIRVMPIRPLKVTLQDALGATVTLEHLGTGRIIELRDSLFRFSSYLDPVLGFEGMYVHNFWTPEEIEPGAAYRFSARREGKEPAEAVVEIPRDYEVEVAIRQSPDTYDPDSLRITGLKHLPFLWMLKTYHENCPPFPPRGVVRERIEARSVDDGTWVTAITKSGLARHAVACSPPVVEKWELWMIGSEAAWPAGGYSPSALGESGRTSNVSNAVGFLGGVLTKLIPYEDCTFESEGAPVPPYCRLRYNRETAMLIGTVSDRGCGPLTDPVEVRLTEMDRDPARVRTARSTPAGEFVIGALEPGIPHFLQVRPPPVRVDSVYVDMCRPHTDTLTFMPGQQVEYDINLQRLTPCSQPPPAAQ
jgi:hypothetical protein